MSSLHRAPRSKTGHLSELSLKRGRHCGRHHVRTRAWIKRLHLDGRIVSLRQRRYRQTRASKETFYSKFTNKNELFRAVMRRLMDRFANQLSSALLTHGAPEKALTAFGGLLLERGLSDEGIALQKIIFMESGRFPEIARIFLELGPQRTKDALCAYFATQVEKGHLRKMDNELAASHFMGMLMSDMMIRKSLGLLAPPTPQEKKRRIKGAVDAFLRAYGPGR